LKPFEIKNGFEMTLVGFELQPLISKKAFSSGKGFRMASSESLLKSRMLKAPFKGFEMASSESLLKSGMLKAPFKGFEMAFS
jgi:hypothetical protein